MAHIVNSPEYKSFRSTVPLKRVIVDDDEDKVWTYYDAGPKDVRCPIVCLPPASGRADVFFKQMLALSSKGYRIMAIEYPVYWNLRQWGDGFRKFLDHLGLDKVHVLGASLGGFLAQKFCEFTRLAPRVHSLVLCNGFVDTTIFQQTNAAPTFWMMPALVLKKMVMGNFDRREVEPAVADSIDFMVTSLDSLSQAELASRLTLNCMNSYVEPQNLRGIPVMLIDVYDDCALSQGVREEVYKCYPEARRAHLKDGGDFPYLSRADEVHVYLQIHLREFHDTRYSPRETTCSREDRDDVIGGSFPLRENPTEGLATS